MKRAIPFFASVLVGVGVGWYWGHSRAISEYQREALKNLPTIEAQMVAIDRQRAEYYKAAKPWEIGTAQIALAGLKDLDTNNTQDARFRFAELVGLYYRSHWNDGDTNHLLTYIVTFAAKDVVLSNEIYGKQ
jgi:hypothetical protein